MLSWFTVITLMVETARVIEMRLRLIALGRGTADEMFLMVTEKIKVLEPEQLSYAAATHRSSSTTIRRLLRPRSHDCRVFRTSRPQFAAPTDFGSRGRLLS